MLSKQLEQYIEAHTSKEDRIQRELNRETHLKTYYPNMLSGHVQGKLLEMISYMIKPRRILEIGTFTAYSAIAMAKGLTENGLLYTIEVNEEMEELILRYLAKAGVDQKVKLLMGDALKIIPSLQETFDLVFIDADKEQYIDYYELALEKLNPGGFILADNVIWGQKVLDDPESTDKETRGIQRFNAHVNKDPRVEQVMLSVRDGLLLVRKCVS